MNSDCEEANEVGWAVEPGEDGLFGLFQQGSRIGQIYRSITGHCCITEQAESSLAPNKVGSPGMAGMILTCCLTVSAIGEFIVKVPEWAAFGVAAVTVTAAE